MKCVICNKEYHHCTNCDFDLAKDHDCCSLDCFEQTKTFIKAREKFSSFYKSLTTEQRSQFDDIINDYSDDEIQYIMDRARYGI